MAFIIGANTVIDNSAQIIVGSGATNFTFNAVFNWGYGSFGQLGNSLFPTSTRSPISVVGGFTDWTQISAGANHTVALRANTAWGWGQNGNGQLGDGTTSNRSSPVSVVGGFTDWTQISAGANHTAAIRTNGTAWTWGRNYHGQLGNNEWSKDLLSPISPQLITFTDWTQISAGANHTAAIRTNGTAWAWGRNNYGQLGDGTTSSRSSPVSVVGGFTDWSQISAADLHTAAIRTNGTAWAWGRNIYSGQLGDGTTSNRSSPVSVVGGFTDWSQISAGLVHTAAIRSNGTAWAWGSNNYGQLGDGTTASRTSPVSVVGGFSDWSQINAGSRHTAAIRTNGTAWAWGWNFRGQLGDGTTYDRSSPVSVIGGFTDWSQISGGEFHTAAIRSNGTAWAWGYNIFGQLGDGTITYRSSPVSVVGGFTDWTQIRASFRSTAGIRANTAWAWGGNFNGQLGDGTTYDRSSPVSVIGGFTDWSQISAGASGNHVAAIRGNTIWSWGSNEGYQLGFIAAKFSPVSVVGGFTDWNQISAGNGFTVGIRANGTGWSWGRNLYGQLGDETTTNRISPVSVVGGFTDWTQISAGLYHTAAIRSNGTAWTWGSNLNGRLGDGTTSTHISPVSVVGGFTDWSQISAGGFHTAAIRSNGTAWTWGSNLNGRLGDGTVASKSSPVSVVGGFTNWTQISAGNNQTVALRANTAWAWGENAFGQLGDGTTSNRSSPVSVIGGINFTSVSSTNGSKITGITSFAVPGTLWFNTTTGTLVGSNGVSWITMTVA